MNLHGFITHSLLPAEAESFRPPYFVFRGDLFIFMEGRGGIWENNRRLPTAQRRAKQSQGRGQPAEASHPLPAAGPRRRSAGGGGGGAARSPAPRQAGGCRQCSPARQSAPHPASRSPLARPLLRTLAIFGVRREPVLSDLITA